MSEWNFNIEEAPKGASKIVKRKVPKTGEEVDVEVHEYILIIAAGNEGVITVSRWLPAEQRWNLFSKNVPPKAWMPWPKHPDEEE